MDKFEGMAAFVRIVETGSITGAAQRLGIAKSAVSRRIRDLEAQLGAQLLHRTTRTVTLTDTGRGFYERAVRILADLREAEVAVSQAHAAVRGRLRVALPLSFGLEHLSPAIAELAQAHPDVELDLDFNDRVVDLVHEGFDAAVRIGQLPDSTLIARPLAPIRSLVCGSPAYLAANGTPATPQDLAQHRALVYSSVPEPTVWRYLDPASAEGGVKVSARLRSNNGDFIRDAAIAGQGLAMLPSFIVYRAVADGRLLPLLTDHTWPLVHAYVVYPPTRHLSRRVRVFVDFLVGRFVGVPYWDEMMNERAAPGTGSSD